MDIDAGFYPGMSRVYGKLMRAPLGILWQLLTKTTDKPH
jgi:hypothetical protein